MSIAQNEKTEEGLGKADRDVRKEEGKEAEEQQVEQRPAFCRDQAPFKRGREQSEQPIRTVKAQRC